MGSVESGSFELHEGLAHNQIDDLLGEALNNGGQLPAEITLSKTEQRLLHTAVAVLAPNIDGSDNYPKLKTSLASLKYAAAEHLEKGETITGLVVAAAILSSPRHRGGLVGKMTAPVFRFIDGSVLGEASQADMALHRAAKKVTVQTFGFEYRRNYEHEKSSTAPILWARAAELAVDCIDTPVAEAVLNSFKQTWDEHKNSGGYPEALINLNAAIMRARLHMARAQTKIHPRAPGFVGDAPLFSAEDCERYAKEALHANDASKSIKACLRLLTLHQAGNADATPALHRLWDKGAPDIIAYLHENLEQIIDGNMTLDEMDFMSRLDPGTIRDPYMQSQLLDIKLAFDTSLRKARVRRRLEKHIAAEATELRKASEPFHKIDARAELRDLVIEYAETLEKERQVKQTEARLTREKDQARAEEATRINRIQVATSVEYNHRVLAPLNELAAQARQAMEKGNMTQLMTTCMALRERTQAAPPETAPLLQGVWMDLWRRAAPMLLADLHKRRKEIAKGELSPYEAMFISELPADISHAPTAKMVDELYDAVRQAAFAHHGLPEFVISTAPNDDDWEGEKHWHASKFSNEDLRAIIFSFIDDLLLTGEDVAWRAKDWPAADDIIRLRARKMEWALNSADLRRLPRRIVRKSNELIHAAQQQRSNSWWRMLRERWRQFRSHYAEAA